MNQDGAKGTNTAQMAWQYARSQPNFHQNFVTAWLKLMTVPANDDEALTDFRYGYRCVDRDGDGTKHPACVGDLFDQKQPILENYKFDSPGTYKIELEQAMRLDTLPFILTVGWRVETAE